MASGLCTSSSPFTYTFPRQSIRLEIPRKLLHSSICIASAVVYISRPNVTTAITTMSIMLVIVVLADLLRFRSPSFEKFYESYLGLFMRESERNEVNGVIYYLVGVLICMTFYPRDIACLSIIVLSLCDTAASVVGRLLGKHTPALPFAGTLFGKKKSLAGTLGAIVFGCLASYIFWTKIASKGDEFDCSWIQARLFSTYSGKPSTAPTFLPRLPNPNSTLSLWALVLLNGVSAGLAEVRSFFFFLLVSKDMLIELLIYIRLLMSLVWMTIYHCPSYLDYSLMLQCIVRYLPLFSRKMEENNSLILEFIPLHLVLG